MATKKTRGVRRSKASASDAELILNLYDLRREEELRQARAFMAQGFWPGSLQDAMGVVNAAGTDENRYFRQALTYWDMAASLVAHRALNPELFFASSGEMYLFYAKLKPYLEGIRRETGNSHYLEYMEEVCEGSAAGRERIARFEKRIATMLKMRRAGK